LSLGFFELVGSFGVDLRLPGLDGGGWWLMCPVALVSVIPCGVSCILLWWCLALVLGSRGEMVWQ